MGGGWGSGQRGRAGGRSRLHDRTALVAGVVAGGAPLLTAGGIDEDPPGAAVVAVDVDEVLAPGVLVVERLVRRPEQPDRRSFLRGGGAEGVERRKEGRKDGQPRQPRQRSRAGWLTVNKRKEIQKARILTNCDRVGCLTYTAEPGPSCGGRSSRVAPPAAECE